MCVSSPKQFGAPPDYRKGVEGFTTPTCQDCYFTRESRVQRQTLTHPNPNLSAPDDSVAVGILYGTDTTTAGEFCFNKLNELGNASFASKEPAFARCLYVQKTFGLASKLDWFILRVVFLLVAMSMAEAQRQQQLICRLRRILLPLPCHMPLRPKNMTTGSILRCWFGILLLTINWFIISLTAPNMLPFGVVFLMLTQGIEASSALLNGLAMGFVLQIDNLVPSIFLSPKVLAKIETYLVGEAVREMAKKDAGGFYGYITASPFIAVATVFMGFITQVYVLNASRSVNCQSLIYLLHYRATILFGLWCTGALCFATEASTCAIIGRQQRVRSPDSSRAIINEDAPVPARQRRVEVGAWHWCSACSSPSPATSSTSSSPR